MPPLPVLATFTVSQKTIAPGQSVTLTWVTTGALRVTLNGVSVALNGTMVVTPAETETFSLVVTGAYTIARRLTVTVSALPAPTATLTQNFGQNVQPSNLPFGITYTSTNADSVTINGSPTVLPGTFDSNNVLVPPGTPWPLSGIFGLQLPPSGTFTVELVATQSATDRTATPPPIVIDIYPFPPGPQPPIPPPILQPSSRPLVGGRKCLDLSKISIVGASGIQGTGVTDINYGNSGLAVRSVNGKLQWLSGGHVSFNDPLYEFSDIPPVDPTIAITDPHNFPSAPTLKAWGDIYGGVKGYYGVGRNPTDSVRTGGMLWIDETHLLISFGRGYNTGAPVTQSLMLITFNPNGSTNPPGPWNGTLPTGCGPWGALPPQWQSNKTGGGILKIPDYFASEFLGGANIGLGFGGSASIVSTDSLGPCFFAVSVPSGPPGNIPYVMLIDSPAAGQDGNLDDMPAIRPGDYSSIGPVWWQDPVNGIGSWTGTDIIFSGACWYDDGVVDGLILASQSGVGNVCYVDSALSADYNETRFYLYASADLAAVAQGLLSPLAIQPVDVRTMAFPVRPGGYNPSNPNAPRNLTVTGMVQIPGTQQIAVLAQTAWQYNPGINQEWSPMKYVLQVGH